MTGSIVHVSAEIEYDVVIGRDLFGSLDQMLPGADRIAVIHAPTQRNLSSQIARLQRDSGLQVLEIELPDAEDAKSSGVAEMCWGLLGDAGFTRNDAIISVGGGATTDLAGFVAATWLRGIRVVHVPTTLLGMVDAAVGGKTGINTSAGKNLVGSFHSPVGVLCDVASLSSLPHIDLVAGMAEVVKVGFARDISILADVRSAPGLALDPAGALLPDLIRRAVQVKADVVSDDFRETSATSADRKLGREVLNYGHTFGHAIERNEGYRWRHGDAVAVGMIYVAELSNLTGHLSAEGVAEHREILELIGLPTTYPAGHWESLLSAMSVDKKARGSLLRFVILDSIGVPTALQGPPAEALRAAYDRISAS
jgi:3-dehydroquinate synthase